MPTSDADTPQPTGTKASGGLVTREIVGGGRLVGTEGGRSEILRPRSFPLHHTEAGGIVDDVSGADRHASDDAHVSIHAGYAAIDVAKFAVKFLEDGDIGFLY